MKKFLVTIFFLFTISKLTAKEITWYAGSVVLSSEKVLVGEISIENNHDLILFRHGDQVNVLPAHKIQAFQFYDKQANINRKFISVQESTLVWRGYTLYEVVLQGEVSVLRKEKGLATRQKSDVDDFFYAIRQREEITDLKSFRKKVYPGMMKKTGALLSIFMLDNHLNPNKPANAIQIIKYYNELMRNDQALARQ